MTVPTPGTPLPRAPGPRAPGQDAPGQGAPPPRTPGRPGRRLGRAARQAAALAAAAAPSRPAGPAPPAPAGQQAPQHAPGGAYRRGRVAAVIALPAADLIGLLLAVAVTGQARPAVALYVVGVLVALTYLGQHRLRICLRASDQAGRVLAAAAVPTLLLLPWLPDRQAAALTLWSAGLVLACRAVACVGVRAGRRRGLLTETALVVGTGMLGARLAELMLEHPELGLAPQGFVDDGTPRGNLALPCLGSLDELARVVARLHIGRVIISFTSCSDEDLVAVLRACLALRADVCLVPRLYELGTAAPAGCLDEIRGIPLMPLRRPWQAPAGRAAKRAFDIVTAALLLAVTAPLLLVLAAAIRLQSGQSPLFRQVRLTGAGRPVTILKLRTLTGHPASDTSWTAGSQQSSRLGALLRATHLDELPQLLNVLRGDMSLVGPRPERPYFAEQFGREFPRYADRERVPAGLTGWAQVHGLHGDTSISDRASFDNHYIENWSPWLDVVILARTIAAAIPVGSGGKS